MARYQGDVFKFLGHNGEMYHEKVQIRKRLKLQNIEEKIDFFFVSEPSPNTIKDITRGKEDIGV